MWRRFGGAAPRVESVASVGEPMPFALDEFTPRDPLREPLPGWRCAGASAAEATLFGGVDVVTGASSGTLTAGIVVELGRASCP